MKSRLIINPVSGTDSAASNIVKINEFVRNNFGDLDISVTVEANDAMNIAAKTAVDPIYSHIFIAGGDGTLNEVLNGVANVEGALDRITFGLIPLGTGNDFADALGLPENVDQTLEILQQKQTVLVDVGKLNEQFFINVSAGGFIAEVSDAVNPELKSFAGKLAYLFGGAQVLFEFEPVQTHLRFINENNQPEERDTEIEMFAVCNSRMIGGGNQIAPQALADDGFFDVCIFKAMTTFEFFSLLPYIASGNHLGDERVEYFRTKEIEMHFNRPTKVNADGEVFPANHCHYQIFPQAARFLAGSAPFFSQIKVQTHSESAYPLPLQTVTP